MHAQRNRLKKCSIQVHNLRRRDFMRKLFQQRQTHQALFYLQTSKLKKVERMRRSKSQEKTRCRSRLHQNETPRIQKTLQLSRLRIPLLLLQKQPMERRRVQETRHQDWRTLVHDVQGPSEILPQKASMWPFHPPQMFKKKNRKGQALLQARRSEILIGIRVTLKTRGAQQESRIRN